MAVNDPIWSYGNSKLIKSSGATVDEDDVVWSYGLLLILHEYVAAGGLIMMMQQMNQFNGGTIL